MLDLESMRELNKSKFNEPETLQKLLEQEYMLSGRIIVPKLSSLRHICDKCVLKGTPCGERMFDDLGSVIPDCYTDYPHPVYYEFKQ